MKTKMQKRKWLLIWRPPRSRASRRLLIFSAADHGISAGPNPVRNLLYEILLHKCLRDLGVVGRRLRRQLSHVGWPQLVLDSKAQIELVLDLEACYSIDLLETPAKACFTGVAVDNLKIVD